jgi:transcriptional regulator
MLLSAVLGRAFAADEIDAVKRELGQTKDLSSAAAFQMKQILELKSQGKTYTEIARLLGCSRRAVSRVVERARKSTTYPEPSDKPDR